MIHVGGSFNIILKNGDFKWGKSNKSGKAEIKVIMALLGDTYSRDVNLIIEHIKSRTLRGRPKSTSDISLAVHNYQYGSKDSSNLVYDFKLLSGSQREKVLKAIEERNEIRRADCRAHNKICASAARGTAPQAASHMGLVIIGETQLKKLTKIHNVLERQKRIHDFTLLDRHSRLHKWTNLTSKHKTHRKVKIGTTNSTSILSKKGNTMFRTEKNIKKKLRN